MTKTQKMDPSANDKSALYKNLSADLKRAQKQLEERIKMEDEKGIKRLQEIIKNLNQTLEGHVN
mgnify:CR=1 FL=1